MKNQLLLMLMKKAPSTLSDADWQPLAELDAILLLSGESTAEEEAVKKSTAFQARKSTRFIGILKNMVGWRWRLRSWVGVTFLRFRRGFWGMNSHLLFSLFRRMGSRSSLRRIRVRF